MAPLSLSPQVFAILSALISERAGLHFDAGHLALFAEKVSARAVEVGFESLLDYYYFLRYDAGGAEELGALVESLVVGETYLFRELAPLQTVVSEFIVPRLARGDGRPRVWCAACSTGEEPHTLAMLLAARGILNDVEIVASDISNVALTRARSSQFGKRALRQEMPAFAQRWLEVTDRTVMVSPRLTEVIDWRRVNLVVDDEVASLGTFDVVICRNVLIYFNDQTVRRVVTRLTGTLRPGGALFVGVSESLLRFGMPLLCEEQNGVFFYKKAT